MTASRRLERRPDDAAVRALYQAHGGELYRFARRLLGDGGAAEEVVQETFLRAWRRWDRYDPEVASLRTWLFAIARNAAIDVARARRARPLGHVVDAEPRPEAAADHADDVLRAWQVEEALARLTPHHREAVVATYYQQRPHAEVAGELGIPVGTLRSRVYYGLRSLRLALEEVGWTDAR